MPWKPLIAALLLTMMSYSGGRAEEGKPDAAARETAIEAFIQGDYDRSLEILDPMARAGDPIAQYILAYAYEAGLGRAQDLDTAVRWYERAAEGGHLEAMVRLGEMYAVGYGVPEKDEARAIQYVARAARHGYPLAQHVLGMFNLWGVLGTDRNPETAKTFIDLAAAQGFGPSMSIKMALEMPEKRREALVTEMAETRDRYAANQVLEFDSQAACLDELKTWSLQAASLYFGLIVVEEREGYFFAALLGGGAPFSPLGESYWECSEGRLRMWH